MVMAGCVLVVAVITQIHTRTRGRNALSILERGGAGRGVGRECYHGGSRGAQGALAAVSLPPERDRVRRHLRESPPPRASGPWHMRSLCLLAGTKWKETG